MTLCRHRLHDMTLPDAWIVRRNGKRTCRACVHVKDNTTARREAQRLRARARQADPVRREAINAKRRKGPRPPVQFCPQGHDTFVTGRYPRGQCRVCVAERAVAFAKTNRGQQLGRKRVQRYQESHPGSVTFSSTKSRAKRRLIEHGIEL